MSKTWPSAIENYSGYLLFRDYALNGGEESVPQLGFYEDVSRQSIEKSLHSPFLWTD